MSDHRHGRTHRQAALVLTSSCDACSHLIPGATRSGPDCNMGLAHADCAAGLLAEGWIRTPSSDGGPDDLTCIHYHLANWEGGHDADCCGLG